MLELIHLPRNAISTHSLTKRLTLATMGEWKNFTHFNSQPHEEADRKEKNMPQEQFNFNSQPHEEADLG